MDICKTLKDKFPFAGRMTSMSDLGSSCSIAGDDALGVNEAYLSHDRLSLPLTDAMCRLEFISGGKAVKGKLESHHYPHGLGQVFSADGFECRVFTCFDALNTPVIHLELTCRKKAEVAISLIGHIPAREGASGKYELDPASGVLFIKRTEPRLDLRDPAPVFDAWAAVKPGFEIENAALSGSPIQPGEAGEHHGAWPEMHYRLTGRPIALEPGVPYRAFVALALSTRQPEFKTWAAARFGEVIGDIGEAEKSARERCNAAFASAPEPKTDDPGLRDLYYHSICVLRRNTHYPDGLFGSHRAYYPCKNYYDAHWMWDSGFHVAALSELDLDLANDAISILLENQLPDGRIPHFVTVDWIRPYEGSQPPVVAWGAWKVYERTKDIEFLRAIYRPFARNTDWWMEARDEDGDGLLEWFERLESGWDNSPRWDPEFGKLETCDLNSYVLMQMKIMAKMADELGRPDEARDWRSKADALGKRMVEKLYFPEENIFRDIRYDTHEPADILTPASFLPLWAGAPLDREKAKAMIRDYLLNPRYFYGEIPFPTVAYCDPKYDSAAFWRGPTWMNISYLLLEMLVERGFVKEAEKTAKALLDIGARNRYIYEYYDSQTGEGLGVPEYSWTAALFMEMLLGRYKNC